MSVPDSPAIVTRGLGKSYARHGLRHHETVHALRDLSIEVRRGEIFGFLGPNGAGKSTTIRILLGFLHATDGAATVLGHDVRTDGLAIRAATGYLPGGIAFHDTMTGAEVLDYLARVHRRPAPLRDELIARLELSRRDLSRLVRDYSRGMRQKIGIVQAMQHDPELLVLDEPSEGLDPLMQRAFYGLLEDRRAAGRTIFFSSHVLSEVERVCDRVAIIRGGALVALAGVGELLSRRRRDVDLRFDGPPPVLADVPGVHDVAVEPGRLTCRIDGEVGPFLAAIAGTTVRDLVIEPARLEDAFMAYYEPTGTGA